MGIFQNSLKVENKFKFYWETPEHRTPMFCLLRSHIFQNPVINPHKSNLVIFLPISLRSGDRLSLNYVSQSVDCAGAAGYMVVDLNVIDLQREERIKATHKVLNGDETVVATYFKGRKPDPGPDPTKNISYYNNYKEVLLLVWLSDHKSIILLPTKFKARAQNHECDHSLNVILQCNISFFISCFNNNIMLQNLSPEHFIAIG